MIPGRVAEAKLTAELRGSVVLPLNSRGENEGGSDSLYSEPAKAEHTACSLNSG